MEVPIFSLSIPLLSLTPVTAADSDTNIHLVQPSDCGEFELPDVIDFLIQSGRTIDAIRMDGWRIDVGYPEDREEAERRLTDADGDLEASNDVSAEPGAQQ